MQRRRTCKSSILGIIKMKIYFVFFTNFVITSAIPQFRKLTDLASTGLFETETLPDYFGFDLDDFDAADRHDIE